MKKKDQKLWGIYVLDNETTVVTRHRTQPTWDNDDTLTTHSIQGFVVVPEKKYHDISVSYEPDYQRVYFLLYCLYKTGDSFHKEEGKIVFIDLLESVEVAEENRRRIEKHYKTHSDLGGKEDKAFDPYSVELITGKGATYKVYCGWTGYFDRLEDCRIECVRRKVV